MVPVTATARTVYPGGSIRSRSAESGASPGLFGPQRLPQSSSMPRSPRLTVLIAALACGSILSGTMLARPVFAQSRQTDQELKDLIPDSAIENPQAWANQPSAAATAPVTPMTPDSALAAADPSQPLPDLSGLVLAWPDTATMPNIDPLAPDIDLAAANAANEAAARELATEERATLRPGDTTGPRTARNDTIGVGRAVELAFPADPATFPDREALAARFGALSSLKSLDSKSDTLAQVARRAESDRKALVSLMRLYGYYDPEVTQTIGGKGGVFDGGVDAGMVSVGIVAHATTDAGSAGAASKSSAVPSEPAAERPVVRFDIVPGPLYHFRTVILGDLETTGTDYPILRAAYPVKVGDPVNTDHILAADMQLNNALGENGYVFGRVGDGELTIDHDPRLGDLTVPVTNGGKFAIGNVVSQSPDFLSSDHLRRIARFRKGQVARTSGLTDLRQAVLATGLVSSVTVTPKKVAEPTAGTPGIVDVDVVLTPAPLRTVAGQLGYSSGQGARLELSWENRNLFPPEGLLRLRGVAGTREQLAGITFRRNNFRTRDQVLTADMFIESVKYTAYTAKTVSFITTLQRQATLLFQKPFTYSLGLEAVATRDTNGSTVGLQSIPQTYFVLALPLQAGYDGSDSLLDPSRGFRLGLRVSPETSRTLGQQSTYLKAQFDASAYKPVGAGVVLAGRMRFGSIVGADIASIAPSRRFYAGGGGSVRGYGYQEIGPKNVVSSTGTLLPSGGRALTEFSLEARVKTGLLGGAISVVPFLDAGAVDPGSTPAFHDIKAGAGLGIRYLTNFGPIRIDVGTPLNRGPNDSRIGVYVALGQAF
jgi:translocation and assembly module TamA